MPTKVLGLKEIEKALEQIPVKMQQNVLRSGNRALANEFVKRVRNNPNVPAQVKKAVMAATDPKRQATRAYLIGLRKPFSKLMHLIEFGTAERFHKPAVVVKFGVFRTRSGKRKSTGRMPANPILRPILDELGGDLSSQIWAKAASRNFELQMRKLARK